MRKFLRNESGVGAIEFALIAPMMAVVLLGIMSGWAYYQQNNYMRDGLEVAGKYFLQGGTSQATAKSIAEAAWSGKPADGTVAVNKTCFCAGAAASCSTVCSDASVPETHWTIEASSVFNDPFIVNPMFPDGLALYEREIIRVR
jgi:Flp pilus assembly protein TadG